MNRCLIVLIKEEFSGSCCIGSSDKSKKKNIYLFNFLGNSNAAITKGTFGILNKNYYKNYNLYY